MPNDLLFSDLILELEELLDYARADYPETVRNAILLRIKVIVAQIENLTFEIPLQ